jgi:hypothetical protein
LEIYSYTARRIFKCKACRKQFSATSQTLFASHKLPHRSYLLAIAIFANDAKGHAALQLSRDLDVQYKTAFVLSHKLREAIGSQVHDPATLELAGEAQIDGLYTGGHVRPENRKEDRVDRRSETGQRQVVVVALERLGRTIPFVVARESDAVPLIRQVIASGTVVHADEAAARDRLLASYPMLRVNHSREFKSEEGACTNEAESYFSRLRRAQYGVHHRIAGPYLDQYANEMAWREDNRRIPNGLQWRLIGRSALRLPKSNRCCGYWQRSAAA